MEKIIYMPLLQEGADCWRPVRAVQIDNEVFRVTEELREGECWAFGPGSRVRCGERVFADGQVGPVALAYAVESDPNYQLLKGHENEIFRVSFREGKESVVKILYIDERNEDFVYDPLSTSCDGGQSGKRREPTYVAKFAELVSARLER